MTIKSKLIALWRRIWHRHSKPFFIVAGSGFLIVAGYVLIPWLYQPYIRVSGNIVTLSLHCVPQSLQLESLTEHSVVKGADVVVKDLKDGRGVSIGALLAPPTRGHSKTTSGLMLRPEDILKVETFALEHGSRSRIQARIEYFPTPYIDLNSVIITAANTGRSDCKDQELRADALLSDLSREPARLMRYSLLQDKLSDLLLSVNESAGNIVLACMMIWSLLLVAELSSGLWRSRFADDETIKSIYSNYASRAPGELKAEGPETLVNAIYLQVLRRLSFARVIGPALGFMLTVSSLVAGLHPSMHSTHDTFYFISSLQIALVATFMGLAMRVLAEFSIRAHRSSADRMIELIVRND